MVRGPHFGFTQERLCDEGCGDSLRAQFLEAL